MIIDLHGFPGAGKTTVLTMIAQRSLQGKSTLGLKPSSTVFTTFPCPGCYEIDPHLLGKYNFNNCLILVDEVSLYFDNRSWKDFSENYLYFFKLHRHFKVDVVVCSQSAKDADAKIRAVTETSYIIDKLPFGFTAIKPILKDHGLKSGEPAEIFELAPPIYWTFCYRPMWYKYFDSFQTKKLPEPELKLWECSEVKK